MEQQTILVIGGTGTIGRSVVRRLYECGYRVRVLSRHPSLARPSFDPAIEILQGDVLNPCDLRSGLEGCGSLHISIATEHEGSCVRQIINEARACNIQFMTYVSGTSARAENRWFPLIGEKLDAEVAIRESGIPFAILRPTWFMEVLANFNRHKRPVMIGNGSVVFHWLAADDFARVVVNTHLNTEAWNRTFTIHGPEALSVNEALERYCATLLPEAGKVLRMPFWVANLLAWLTGNEDLKDASELLAYFEKVGEPGDPTEANETLGAPTTTLNEWLALQHWLKQESRPVSR